MKKNTIISFFLVFLYSCLTSTLSYAAAVNVLFPPNETYVENESLNLVIKMDDTVDSFRVKVNKFEYPPKNTIAGKEFSYMDIFLAAGMNTVTVTGFKGKQKVAASELKVYLRDKLNQEFNQAPMGFKRYFYHTAENEKLCSDCHRMEVTINDMEPDSPEDSPCFTCHRSRIENKYTHYPASEWTCLECHLTGKGANRKYAVSMPTMDVCYSCHGIQIKEWKSENVMHGPTAVGQCELCHDPHGSDWTALVRMHATDLCLRCHTDKATGKHVIAGFYGKGHPVRGAPDPRDPSREFSCASCHNPHGAETNGLLNFPRPRGGKSFCRNCHNY